MQLPHTAACGNQHPCLQFESYPRSDTSSAVSDTEISIVIELEQSKHPGNLIIPASIDLAAPPRSGCLWLGGYQACREPFLKARGITVVLNTARALEKFYPAWGKEVARMEGAGRTPPRISTASVCAVTWR